MKSVVCQFWQTIDIPVFA